MSMHGRLHDEVLTRAFDAGAPSYDAMVGRNPGYHEHLRLSVERLAIPDGGRGLRLLDVGCGTGASTAALLAAAPHAEIVAIDASEQMLARARAKRWPATVHFVHSPVEGLEAALADAGLGGPFDAVLAAYLIRNLTDPDAQLRSLRRQLRPGGRIGVHDYVAGADLAARLTWRLVCWGIVVPLALLHRSDMGLYRHLWRSVADFDDADRLVQRLRGAGFVDVRAVGMRGWQRGIEYTFLAQRPLAAAAGPQRDERSA
jgi:ubiquinone/menaquinone biosynthesis C-methylase UbiE